MTSLYRKLNLSKDDLIELINNLYWKEELSQSKIAAKFNCHITTIENFFKENGIKSRNPSASIKIVKRRNCDINQRQEEVLNGLMLSDFHIEDGNFQSRISFGFKHLEFANLCINELNCFEWQEIKKYEPSNCWHSKTKFYEKLKNYRNMWYAENKKIVPDIHISSLTLMFWFLGNGMAVQKNKSAILCTESFSHKENKKLSEKIALLGIKNHVTPSNRIRISGKSGYKKLIDIIGNSPVQCYNYKFNYE
jgi:hypothetical protein